MIVTTTDIIHVADMIERVTTPLNRLYVLSIYVIDSVIGMLRAKNLAYLQLYLGLSLAERYKQYSIRMRYVLFITFTPFQALYNTYMK